MARDAKTLVSNGGASRAGEKRKNPRNPRNRAGEKRKNPENRDPKKRGSGLGWNGKITALLS